MRSVDPNYILVLGMLFKVNTGSKQVSKRELSLYGLREWLGQLYKRTLSPATNLKTIETASLLRSVPLFSGFKRRELLRFADALHLRSYRKDEYLYRERDPGLGMYIIQSGRVRLLTEDEDGGLHEVKQVSNLGVIGEFALLGDFRRMESAQAVTETRVLGFFRPELKSMVKRDPRTAALLLFALAEHVSEYYVELSSYLIEKDGKMAARRSMDAAQSRLLNQQDGSSSFVVRS